MKYTMKRRQKSTTKALLQHSPVGDDIVFPRISSDTLQLPVSGCQLSDSGDAGEENGTVVQVIVLDHDVFTCGVCSKRFGDLMVFLAHKSEHLVADQFHKCELCKMIFVDTRLLLKHYRMLHGLSQFCIDESNEDDVSGEDSQQLLRHKDVELDDAMPDIENESIVKIEQMAECKNYEVSGDFVTMAMGDCNSAERISDLQESLSSAIASTDSTSMQKPTTNVAMATSDIPTAYDDDVGQTLTQPVDGPPEQIGTESHTGYTLVPDKEPESKTCPVEDEKGQSDFHFILLMEGVGGTSKKYSRCSLLCLHCDFKTRSKVSLTKHTWDKHADMMPINVALNPPKKELPEAPGEFRQVMKLSEYTSMLAAERKPLRPGKKGRKVEKQDIPGSFSCNQCSKMFSRLRYLRKHLHTHKTDVKFVCDTCGKSFKCRTYLRAHKNAVHQEKMFKCSQCDFTSRINAVIHSHRQIHSHGSILCEVCGYAYSDKSTLAKHMRVHDNTRPWACNYPGCSWRFKSEIMCKAHIRAHTIQGKFKCSVCGYVFRHKHHLQRHESNMHDITHSKTRADELQANKTVFADDMAADLHAVTVDVESTAIPHTETEESVNVISGSEDMAAEVLLDQGSVGQQHYVVTADSQGTPIAWELIEAYQQLTSTAGDPDSLGTDRSLPAISSHCRGPR